MMVRSALLALLLSTYAGGATPRDAELVISESCATARAEHKPVFVHFAASWCVWCRRLDALLAEPSVRVIMEKRFVLVRLDVLEHGKIELENPNGVAVLKRLGGDRAGLPYFAVIDASGKIVADSKRPDADGQRTNIGFPSTPDEIAWFIEMLRRSLPQVTESEVQTIASQLRAVPASVGHPN